MKPGNLRELKVPNPAVRRKMRLEKGILTRTVDWQRAFFIAYEAETQRRNLI